MWYEAVPANTRLTQGDFVLECPVLTWAAEPMNPDEREEKEVLEGMVRAQRADVVVMTQACDLENEKVQIVILCPHLSLSEYKKAWEGAERARGQNPNRDSWRKHFNRVREGFVWNLALLNEGVAGGLRTEHRIVDFHEVFTIPRKFLESWLEKQDQHRLRLLPPYREHLSQAFARFFMRVGLPVPVTPLP